MKRICLVLAVISVFGYQISSAADLKVMTQNQYLGADLSPLYSAQTGAELNAAVIAALHQVAENRPFQRIARMGAEIVRESPDLVGLQEVTLFACKDVGRAELGAGCHDPSIAAAFVDHLAATLAVLDGNYELAAVVDNLGVILPVFVNGKFILVAVLDRDVILARQGLSAQPAVLCETPSASGQGCNYQTMLSVPTPIGPIAIKRGYVGVDATIDGKQYRFVTTHLEEKFDDPSANLIQIGQAAELLQSILPGQQVAAAPGLVVVGDMNSSPVDPMALGNPTPYMQFVDAGFTDVWKFRRGDAPGLTCCQNADLRNVKSALYERIDMIFSSELPNSVEYARLVGATILEKTFPILHGLWPSDHAGVSAELGFAATAEQ